MASPASESASSSDPSYPTPPMSSQHKRPVRTVLFDVGYETDGSFGCYVTPAGRWLC